MRASFVPMPLTSISTDNDVLAFSWFFASPAESVWAGFQDWDTLSQWLGRPIEVDLKAGGTLVVDHGEGYTSRSVVTEADSPSRLSMTWEFPDEPQSRITLTLSPEGAGSRMDFEHHDLGDLRNSYGPGWITHLSYLEAAVSGTPLPSSQFWPLHATFAMLYAVTELPSAASPPVDSLRRVSGDHAG